MTCSKPSPAAASTPDSRQRLRSGSRIATGSQLNSVVESTGAAACWSRPGRTTPAGRRRCGLRAPATATGRPPKKPAAAEDAVAGHDEHAGHEQDRHDRRRARPWPRCPSCARRGYSSRPGVTPRSGSVALAIGSPQLRQTRAAGVVAQPARRARDAPCGVRAPRLPRSRHPRGAWTLLSSTRCCHTSATAERAPPCGTRLSCYTIRRGQAAASASRSIGMIVAP